MIFQNIELHNVAQVKRNPEGEGYLMLRSPEAVGAALSEQGQRQNTAGTGVELRFVVNSPEGAFITMRLRTEEQAVRCIPVYYGSIGACWQEAVKPVTWEKTRFHVAPPSDPDKLERISRMSGYPFDPRVVRLILPVGQYEIFGVEGDVTPPAPDMLPKRRYLAYGSSITHGSLSLLPMQRYAMRAAEALSADLINLGYAGSARMEKDMADHIAARDDWDFATLEMGINALDMSCELFAERVSYFIEKIAASHPDKKVFCIDLVYYWGDVDGSEKANAFREIVRREAARHANAVYADGRDILSIGAAGLSGDFTHPNLRGHEVMGDNLARLIRSWL